MTISTPPTVPLLGQSYGNAADVLNTALAGIVTSANTDIAAKADTSAMTTALAAKADTSAMTTALAAKADKIVTHTQQAGTAYTLVLADASTTVELTSADAVAVTVPPHSSVAYPVGTVITLRQHGAGQVTVTAGVGVTLRAPVGAKTAHQYGAVAIVQRAADEWVISGDAAA